MTFQEWIAQIRLDAVVLAAQENSRRREAARHLTGQVGAVLHQLYPQERSFHAYPVDAHKR